MQCLLEEDCKPPESDVTLEIQTKKDIEKRKERVGEGGREGRRKGEREKDKEKKRESASF